MAISLSGTVDPSQITATGVTPGSYTNTNITVNAAGQVTAASNGTSGSGGGGSSSSGRIVATTNITLYVAPTSPAASSYWGVTSQAVTAGGNDTTGTGAKTAPFATPQKAVNYLYANYDLAGQYGATIQLAVAPAGSYNFYPGVNISGRVVGQVGCFPPLVVGGGVPNFNYGVYAPIALLGDQTGTNPLGAFINPGGSGRPVNGGLTMTDGAALRLFGVAFDTALCATDCISVFPHCFLDIGNVLFGNAGVPGTGYNNHISLYDSNMLINGAGWQINGSANYHLYAARSTVNVNNNLDPGLPIPITVNAAVSFPAGFVLSDGSLMYMGGLAFGGAGVGSVSGPSAVLMRNGVIQTGGSGTGVNSGNPNYFPGNGTVTRQDNSVYR